MADSHHTLEIDGRAVPLRVRRNALARQLILRIDEDTDGAVVTIPARAPIKEGLEMARRKTDWIARQLAKRPARVPFAEGEVVPYLGVPLTVARDPHGHGIRQEDGRLVVSGHAEHLPRRLLDWLRAQAKAEIAERAHAKARRLDMRIGHITIRDTRSRWGSCTVDGDLNFSWRLILTPEYVLDYVVAHEVAHFVHRDHGPAFWTLAGSLTGRMADAKAWLNAQGRELYRYG